MFDRRRIFHVALPAPAFFDFQTKGRHVITREEANEYERRTEAARLQAATRQAVAAAFTTPATTLDIHQASRGDKPS